jgi:ribose transport system substrate-binding protein
LTAVVAASSALLLAACSSSGSTNSGSTSTTGGTTASQSSGAASDGVAQAKAYVQKFLKAPTAINVTAALSKKPDAGKTVIGLDSGTGSAKVLAQYWKQAAEDLGWTYKDVIMSATPEDQQKAFESALQQNPDGILTSGIPISTLKSQLAEAAAKHVWVNTSASTDQPSGAMFDTSIANPAQLTEWGKMVAAYVVSESNGNAQILDFSLPVYPTLETFDKGFQAAIKQWCPSSCKVTEIPQQGTDIGTKTPQAVVSAAQGNPNAKWLIFDLGDLATGVDAAIQAAGLTGLHIGGLTADAPNFTALKTKKEDVWTAYPLAVVGYRQIDSLARKFNGDPIVEATLPTELATQDNIADLTMDTTGNFVGVSDYREQFKKLWQVTG